MVHDRYGYARAYAGPYFKFPCKHGIVVIYKLLILCSCVQNHSAAIDFKMLGLLIEQQYLDFNFDLN